MEFGKPGSVSSLILRVAQAVSTALTLTFLILNPPFYIFTLTRCLALAAFVQMAWSLLMIFFDIFLFKHGHLLNRTTLAIFLVVDFAVELLLLAATSASCSMLVFLKHDSNMCRYMEDNCDKFSVAVGFAVFGWSLSCTSAFAMFVHWARAH